MDTYLLQLINKIDKLPMTQEEKDKYLNELDIRVRTKLLDVLYENSSPDSNQKLTEISNKLNLENYYEVLEKEIKTKELLEALAKAYIEIMDKEINSFPK